MKFPSFFRLLLLQVAKARKCRLNDMEYEMQSKQICSMVFSEVYNMDFFNMMGEMFDLFLEESKCSSHFFNFSFCIIIKIVESIKIISQTIWLLKEPIDNSAQSLNHRIEKIGNYCYVKVKFAMQRNDATFVVDCHYFVDYIFFIVWNRLFE